MGKTAGEVRQESPMALAQPEHKYERLSKP